MSTTFIGGGNMASALAGGLCARGSPPAEIRIVEPLAEQRVRLDERLPGVATFSEPSAAALDGARLVVLAVKPQQMPIACKALAVHLGPDVLVLSIAAGTRIADIARWLGGAQPIARAMPNTPALVGKGISGIYAPPSVDAAGRGRIEQVLGAAGEIVWVDDEAMLDAITGVSGSGPAYVFYFIEALEQAARELGIAAAQARKLAYATFDGAVALARASASDAGELRAQVTSKGGTTERAIASMEHDAVKAAIVKAVGAAAQRARELGDVLGRDA